MKTKPFSILIGGAITLLTISCHNSTNPNNPATTQNPDSMRQDKTRVYVDTAEETTFKQHEETLIKENDKKIAELKEKIKKEKREAKRGYDEQLDTLKAENSRMETRLDKLGQETRSDWETFKYNFNRDMDSLGSSISRFAERNMKSDKQQ